jgi:hypothetical protein
MRLKPETTFFFYHELKLVAINYREYVNDNRELFHERV